MVEQQAVERVHRIGQTRAVIITRYIIQDSFEVVWLFEKLYEIVQTSNKLCRIC